MAGCHTQGPPTVEGLTALHHYQVDQVPYQRLVVGRQQQRVQAEEHTFLHHSTVSIHAGHMHLERKEVIRFITKQGFNITQLD